MYRVARTLASSGPSYSNHGCKYISMHMFVDFCVHAHAHGLNTCLPTCLHACLHVRLCAHICSCVQKPACLYAKQDTCRSWTPARLAGCVRRAVRGVTAPPPPPRSRRWADFAARDPPPAPPRQQRHRVGAAALAPDERSRLRLRSFNVGSINRLDRPLVL